MNDWIAKLHSFLNINDHDILTHAGQIPHGMALAFAESQYVQFHTTRVKAKNTLPSEFDCAVT